ncbi:hypothetical protein AU156_gp291 [Edwardsiella phage PEi20]|uniref:Uncharacterized protein n=2 Tax=Kanagawavirus pei20 TaxID=2844109 RepID=A0A0B6VLK7_9CAUD|nr:hypothetical protein AU156_gp291 [Edwardsiella phage PEi20]BAQ22809.1 conserved hypothetical protein [Edwardsiella phage PEi20]BAQ23112.1 conserved hypothetical protein [Edwardsiella phage PEi26]
MKTYDEFLTESYAPGVISDKSGDTHFGLMKNDDGVYFQIGAERFQTSKYSKDAVLKVLQGGGKWKGKMGTKEVGVAIEGNMAYFKIGDEQYILSAKAFKELKAAFK